MSQYKLLNRENVKQHEWCRIVNSLTELRSAIWMYPDLDYTDSMEDITVIGTIVKPEPKQRTEAALAFQQSDDYALVSQHTSQHVAPQQHKEPMHVPINSMPPEELRPDSKKDGQNMFTEDFIDSESIKGIFGWETVDDTSIPYILRSQKKFVSVRIVERKLLSKYPNTFPDELGKKDPLVSHFITEAEANLLNEINTAHCDFEYGHNPFTVKDLIVDLEEFEEFFQIVKKTFPADVLAKINEEPSPQVMSPSVKPDLSKFCGWIQINNTVSPYIIRFDNGKQVKLVPLSVIVYAAGLLTNSSVDGLLPNQNECAMLNEACKAAGFDFLFGKNTRLISISEVLQRCQVQLFELPFKNPLQNAHYLNPRTGQPFSGATMSLGSQPLCTTASAQHQPSAPMRPHQSSIHILAENHSKQNLYTTGFPQSTIHSSQVTMSGGLSGIAGGPSAFQEPLSPSTIHLLRSQSGTGMEPSHLPSQRGQTLTEKNIDSCNLIQQGLPGPHWPIMLNTPSPVHVNNTANFTVMSETQAVTSVTPNASSYQPHSLRPSPLLHSINSPTMSDLNHPIFRSPMSMPPRSLVTQSVHKDLTTGIGRYTSPVTGLPPISSQYSTTQSFPFRVNQFDNSPFTKSNPKEQRPTGDTKLLSTQPSSRHRAGSESHEHSGLHSTNNNDQSILKVGSHMNSNPHIIQSIQPPNSYSNNVPKPYFPHSISACLINGKSISCINVDLPHRKGRFCLVEAVSKLYFPTVPLTEFVKVLQVVLRVTLIECSSQEEAAFVQYYSLPVNKLKCNKIIKVDDLEMYFPQLSYMFTKCSSNPTHKQTTVHQPLSPHSATQKRRSSSTSSGPPVKTGHPKIENSAQLLHYGRDGTQNGGTSDSMSGREGSIIVIDDE